MENESVAFIEAMKQFVPEWIQREFEMASISPESAAFTEDLSLDNKTLGESDLDLKELSLKISEIIETHLNRNDYWIHRNALFQPDISKDYVEFKKEKIRRRLTSSVRITLECASKIFWKLENRNLRIKDG